MSTPITPPKRVYGPYYFSNWADLFMPKIANLLLPAVLRMPWLTPNVISVSGFIVFLFACFSLFLDYPNHLLYAAIAFPISYVLDCLDGQVARSTGLSSAFGSFLDKTIDFFKVFAITASLAWATYSATGDVLYVFLGYIASFFFTYRFYIKYITVFSEVSKDKEYLTKSKEYTENLYTEIEAHRKQLATTFWGKIKLFLIQNRVILEVEEAELVMFTAVGALFNQLGAVLWILAVSQVLIVAQRLITRGYQVEHAPEKLLAPIKK